MSQIKQTLIQSLCVAMALCVASVAYGQDSDGDGLLDLIDVPGFDSNTSGIVRFTNRGIEDLDGTNLLTQVQELYLRENQITSLESDDFDGLGNLQGLYLAENQITSLESGDFGGLANLLELYLHENQITSLESGTFDGLTNLRELLLHRNLVASIDGGTFDGLTNLRELRLSENQITSISTGAFGGLTNLETLRLSESQITSLERISFGGLANLQELDLAENQITSLESGDFDGLANLLELYLNENQITSIGRGAFGGMANLTTLYLCDNPITELNLSQAVFRDLDELCIWPITSLVLDDATLSNRSFEEIVSETGFTSDVSLIGLRFSDEMPGELANLLSIGSLDTVTVDQGLFDVHADEFNDLAAGDGNTLTVIGYGDANLDGEFNSSDFVTVFDAGEYEDEARVNSTWTTGDWNGDWEFNSDDLILALADGGYEAGPRPAAVPEPGTTVLLLIGAIAIGVRKS